MMAGDILVDVVHAAPSGGIAFDVWHGRAHRPALRAALPDALERRYASAARASLVSILELGADADARRALAATATRPAGVTRIERFIATPIGVQQRPDAGPAERWHDAPIAYPVLFAVPGARAEEFDRWYDEEHLPMLLGCETWLGCRRFRLSTAHDDGITHLALHYLADLSALQSPQHDAARSTPWRDRLATEPWFSGDYRVYHRLA